MEILQTISNTLLLIFLGLSAISDFKYKKISTIVTVAAFICGVVFQLVIGQLHIYEIAGGCILGAVFLLAAKLTREAVGYGDGLILIATGAFLGIMNNLLLLTVSLALAALFMVGMLVVNKARKKSEFPFIPFMLGGYVLMLAFF